MVDLATLEEVRPATATRAERIWLVPARLQWLCLLWGLAGGIVEAWLGWQLWAEGFTVTAWARFLLPQVLVLPFALRAGWQAFKARREWIELDGSSLRFGAPDGEVTIPYDQIAGYRLDLEHAWLSIETWQGETYEVPKHEVAWSKDSMGVLVRSLGPSVPEDASQNRGTRPEGVSAAKIWDHFGDPPPVRMVPGRRYRYLDRAAVGAAELPWSLLLPILLPICGAVPRFFLHRSLEAKAANLVGIALWLVVVAFFAVKYRQARRCADDRFEWAPQGLWVTRGSRRWLVTDPELSTPKAFPIRLHYRPILRFGKGLRTYWFDPRLIVEDD